MVKVMLYMSPNKNLMSSTSRNATRINQGLLNVSPFCFRSLIVYCAFFCQRNTSVFSKCSPEYFRRLDVSLVHIGENAMKT